MSGGFQRRLDACAWPSVIRDCTARKGYIPHAVHADFAFETTLASRTFAPFIRELRDVGYHVQLVYVWLNSADLCVERVRGRAMTGGHFVEEAIVRRRYDRSLRNFFTLYQELADEWEVYDNSGGSGGRLVAEGHGLASSIVHERVIWDEMQRRAGR
jgi:predicted ABC-type ATPase